MLTGVAFEDALLERDLSRVVCPSITQYLNFFPLPIKGEIIVELCYFNYVGRMLELRAITWKAKKASKKHISFITR